MNIFNDMRSLLFCFILPYCLISQEFYPGFLSQLEAPICYNTSTLLSFETLPSGDDEINYTYQWQKSWNQSNWFNIQDAVSINHTTDILNTDTYYRVIVGYQDIYISTNIVPVYVLPPLVSGVLMDVDNLCINDPITFQIPSSGAEFNWGGFSDFSYQWQQGNISINEIIDVNMVDWVNVGDDEDIHIPNIDPGLYCFRCIITSPHGCGTVISEPIITQINDCFNASIEETVCKKQIIETINILGQNSVKGSLIINIYNNDFIEKKYMLE